MQFKTFSRQHEHCFDQGNPLTQKKILYATLLTGVMMLLEIWGGYIFNSMALLADGWHMSSHMLALGLAYMAYRVTRYYARDPRFSFGTWKIEILTAYSSAILLFVVACTMAFQSITRLFNPVQIHYQEAIPIAILGLVINLICAWLLKENHHHHHHDHDHDHDHDHEHGHGHEHDEHSHPHTAATKSRDLNQNAAFLHVVADAVTSVFAIVALFAAKYWDWNFLDALLGIVGAILVGKWSIGLIKETSKILVDAEMDHPLVEKIRQRIAHFAVDTGMPIEITDLHVWKVGQDKFSCILALETAAAHVNADVIRDVLSIYQPLVHISVEVNAATQFRAVPRETQRSPFSSINKQQI